MWLCLSLKEGPKEKSTPYIIKNTIKKKRARVAYGVAPVKKNVVKNISQKNVLFQLLLHGSIVQIKANASCGGAVPFR